VPSTLKRPTPKRFWNDPAVLAKLGEKLGDVPMVPAGGAPAGAAPAAAAPRTVTAPPVPDIDNLWDAAKYGDLEAVEDFIAIGKVRGACKTGWTLAEN
jgi:hypothetical protein